MQHPHPPQHQLPQEILDRGRRVYEFHRGSKHSHESVRAAPVIPSGAQHASPYRTFGEHPKVALPTTLLDEPAPTLSLLEAGKESLPESQRTASQDLKTLATWLFMAGGLTHKIQDEQGKPHWQRAWPSAEDTYPCEIYVLAMGIEGLEPGFYHYSVREYALRKLREAHEALGMIKRGRPDLELLKTVPAAVFVSTIYARSTWRFGKRGYRHALLDGGHLVQNLESAAIGLGIQPLTRFTINESNAREVIGVAADAPFEEAESVQAMVIWADQAHKPLAASTAHGDRPALAPIARAALANEVTAYCSILEVHHDCVAPGSAVREVRPPLTEISPMPANAEVANVPEMGEMGAGRALRQVLAECCSTPSFKRRTITRDQFLTINRLAFRGGSFFPIRPDGPHVGLVRPFWIVHDVTGVNPGIWYYDPAKDHWHCLREAAFRVEAQYLSMEQKIGGDASAVCFIVSNLHALLSQVGPDTYRLAHLEAGTVAQRMLLAAGAMELAGSATAAFYDDEVRQFFGLTQTGWEAIYEVAVGVPGRDGEEINIAKSDGDVEWR